MVKRLYTNVHTSRVPQELIHDDANTTQVEKFIQVSGIVDPTGIGETKFR